jgi:Uma2 family endonuclease
MTFTDYLEYRAPSGYRDELLDGEVVLSPSASRQHQDLCERILEILKTAVSEEYVVRWDTTFQLGETEGPRPDVFVIDKKRWIAADSHGGYPLGSPQIAVEVKSPSNGWPELLRKAKLYLDDSYGLAVWLVDMEKQQIHVHSKTDRLLVNYGGVLSLPQELTCPGASETLLNVGQIFDGILRRATLCWQYTTL